MGYILVDLDHTLMTYHDGQERGMGKPVHPMTERVRRWVKMGKDVRIFTARASRNNQMGYAPELDDIRAWCLEHVGKELPIQCHKDFECEAIWDNLAIGVESNTGFRMTTRWDNFEEPLSDDEEAELLEYMYEEKQ